MNFIPFSDTTSEIANVEDPNNCSSNTFNKILMKEGGCQEEDPDDENEENNHNVPHSYKKQKFNEKSHDIDNNRPELDDKCSDESSSSYDQEKSAENIRKLLEDTEELEDLDEDANLVPQVGVIGEKPKTQKLSPSPFNYGYPANSNHGYGYPIAKKQFFDFKPQAPRNENQNQRNYNEIFQRNPLENYSNMKRPFGNYNHYTERKYVPPEEQSYNYMAPSGNRFSSNQFTGNANHEQMFKRPNISSESFYPNNPYPDMAPTYMNYNQRNADYNNPIYNDRFPHHQAQENQMYDSRGYYPEDIIAAGWNHLQNNYVHNNLPLPKDTRNQKQFSMATNNPFTLSKLTSLNKGYADNQVVSQQLTSRSHSQAELSGDMNDYSVYSENEPSIKGSSKAKVNAPPGLEIFSDPNPNISGSRNESMERDVEGDSPGGQNAMQGGQLKNRFRKGEGSNYRLFN